MVDGQDCGRSGRRKVVPDSNHFSPWLANLDSASYGTYKAVLARVDETAQTTNRKDRTVLRILPLVLIPALTGAVVYWLTRSWISAVITAAAVLAGMLYIGVTS
jgi:hypothetical protein